METEKMLKALGDPTRFRIFRQLLERKHCIRSLSKKMDISESAVSQHMKILRESGLVYGEQYGYHTHYLPAQPAVDVLSEMFSQMKEQSLLLDRTSGVCNCEYKKEEEGR